MLRIWIALFALAATLQAQDVPHLHLAQTKVSKLLVHSVDAQITADIAGDDPLPIFFQVVIGTDGKIESDVPLRGQSTAAIKPAEEVLKQWQYKPIVYQGKPAMIDTIIAVHFNLGSRKAKPENGWFPEGLMKVDWDEAENLKALTPNPKLPPGGTPGGRVYINATLNEKGELENLAVAHAPDPVLGEAALKEVKSWKFQPLHIDDKAVAIDFVIEVKYPKK